MTATDTSLTMLIHGLSKAGKSSLSVTTPAPRLYFDVESASRFLPIKRVIWDPHTSPPPTYDGTWDTCVVRTMSWMDLQQAYQWLAAGQHPFASLIIDSISELQNRYVEQTSGRSAPDLQGWGDIYRQVAGLVRDVRDLTVHPVKPLDAVVMTAMTKNVNGMWQPFVQGQLATLIPYLFDITGYLYVEQVGDALDPMAPTVERRRLITRRTDNFEAGERVQGRIPFLVEGADLSVTRMRELVFPEVAALAAAVTSPPPPAEPPDEAGGTA